MDCFACYRSDPFLRTLPFGLKFVPSQETLNHTNYRHIIFNDQRCHKVISTSAQSRKHNIRNIATPLEPQSSAGKFLGGIMKNQRHLFHIAVHEQLEELAFNRDCAVAREKLSWGTSEWLLHRRIAKMKESECQVAVEEVMYMAIVYKFSEIKVPMIPRLTSCINQGKLDVWPSKDRELESVHSFDILEMIQEHLSTILGPRGKSNATDNWTTSHMKRLQLGRVYAASIMYGYFLRSASLRYHFELCDTLNEHDLFDEDNTYSHAVDFLPGYSKKAILNCMGDKYSSSYHALVGVTKNNKKLRGYIMGFDSNALQRCSKLQFQEAVNLIEKHTWALFANEGMHNIEKEEEVAVTFSSLKRLVLEAVTFGSFLWDVEKYVDSIYKLKES